MGGLSGFLVFSALKCFYDVAFVLLALVRISAVGKTC